MSFKPKALFAAVDAQRQARGMTWDETAKSLNIDGAAFRDLEAGLAMDADTVLQMTRWLGLNIESFIGEGRDPNPGPDPGTWRSTGRMLRCDTAALYAAVDARRRTKDLSWQAVSEAIGAPRVTAPMLLNLKKGGRIDLTAMLAIVAWLGQRPTRFTKLTSG